MRRTWKAPATNRRRGRFVARIESPAWILRIARDTPLQNCAAGPAATSRFLLHPWSPFFIDSIGPPQDARALTACCDAVVAVAWAAPPRVVCSQFPAIWGPARRSGLARSLANGNAENHPRRHRDGVPNHGHRRDPHAPDARRRAGREDRLRQGVQLLGRQDLLNRDRHVVGQQPLGAPRARGD